MAWRIVFERKAERELARLDPQIARRLLVFLNERVAPLDDPRAIGEALRGPRLGEFWKYRVGDWRIVSRIEDERVTVLVLRIGNRRALYR